MARTNNKLSDKAKKSAIHRYSLFLQNCWNYERMQASGYAYSMLPAMKELYDTDEEVCQQLERHNQFYNTHNLSASLQFGASLALEEDYQTDMSDSLKVALMGPLAGIGDTIVGVLIQPLAYMMSASLAAAGSFLSLFWLIIPFFFVVFYPRYPLARLGYKRSVNIIDDISANSNFNIIRDAAHILGLTVAGGFIPSMINATIKWTYTRVINDVESVIRIQDVFDGFIPYLLPVCFVGLCYWLLKFKKVKTIIVIGIIAVIGFIFGAIGIM